MGDNFLPLQFQNSRDSGDFLIIYFPENQVRHWSYNVQQNDTKKNIQTM